MDGRWAGCVLAGILLGGCVGPMPTTTVTLGGTLWVFIEPTDQISIEENATKPLSAHMASVTVFDAGIMLGSSEVNRSRDIVLEPGRPVTFQGVDGSQLTKGLRFHLCHESETLEDVRVRLGVGSERFEHSFRDIAPCPFPEEIR